MTELAIVIVSYNTRQDLVACLDSLFANPPRASHEVVVVDNASTDGSADAVRAKWAGCRVISLPSNSGFAHANNVGIRATSSHNILLLNSDTIVPRESIDCLLAALHELPGAAIVGPRLVDARGVPELSYGRMMGPLNELRQKVLVRSSGAERLRGMTATPREVDWVSGACLLVRRRHAEAAGLLDERYFLYCEDVDFCAAVRATGGRVYFTPAAEIVHLRGRSGLADPGARNDSYRRSQLAFYEKHHPGWAPFLRFYLGLRGKLPPRAADKKAQERQV
jgi:GT2 family glycosyltransferase